MELHASLRHFDRGSEELAADRFSLPEDVFGGTGACLVMRRAYVEDLIVHGGPRECDVDKIYPSLAVDRDKRALLFDEAFFAYREDADLAWRAKSRGWRCRYVPSAIGYHRRVVLPERRRSLPAELNRMSVRNRFLLQLNNFSLVRDIRMFIPGFIIRNLLVIIGVLCCERSSLPAFRDLWRLTPRAIARRRAMSDRPPRKRREAFDAQLRGA